MPPRLHWGPHLLLPSCVFVHGGHSSSFHEVSFSATPCIPLFVVEWVFSLFLDSIIYQIGIFGNFWCESDDYITRTWRMSLLDSFMPMGFLVSTAIESPPPWYQHHQHPIGCPNIFRSSTCSIWSGWISVGDLPEQHLRPDSSLSDGRRHHLHRDALHIFCGQGCPLQNFWHCWRFLFQHRTTRPCARPRRRLLMPRWFLESSQGATLVRRYTKTYHQAYQTIC